MNAVWPVIGIFALGMAVGFTLKRWQRLADPPPQRRRRWEMWE